MSTAQNIAAVSQWVDDANAQRSVETNLWSRVTKVSEESGEAQAALRGLLGENPRKGVTHTTGDVVRELLDVAVAALGAVEHLTGNKGACMEMLAQHAHFVADRAGVL